MLGEWSRTRRPPVALSTDTSSHASQAFEGSRASGPDGASPMDVRKILVPIDYSDHSARALEWGASLAEKYGARLLLLHVISRYSKDLPEPEPLDLANLSLHRAPSPSPPEGMMTVDLIETAQNDLEDFALAKLTRGSSVTPMVGVGGAAEEIVRVAQEEGVDLIVMGTHGRTGLRHLLTGSVAETVLRTARCPVFTVKAVFRSA